MNPLLEEAVAQVRGAWIPGVMTAVFLGVFLIWIWWAWSARNKARWEADSRLPFTDGGES